jgi:hypothetical protein
MMPKSDPEARSMTSANNREAITSVKLFMSPAREPQKTSNVKNSRTV